MQVIYSTRVRGHTELPSNLPAPPFHAENGVLGKASTSVQLKCLQVLHHSVLGNGIKRDEQDVDKPDRERGIISNSVNMIMQTLKLTNWAYTSKGMTNLAAKFDSI